MNQYIDHTRKPTREKCNVCDQNCMWLLRNSKPGAKSKCLAYNTVLYSKYHYEKHKCLDCVTNGIPGRVIVPEVKKQKKARPYTPKPFCGDCKHLTEHPNESTKSCRWCEWFGETIWRTRQAKHRNTLPILYVKCVECIKTVDERFEDGS